MKTERELLKKTQTEIKQSNKTSEINLTNRLKTWKRESQGSKTR